MKVSGGNCNVKVSSLNGDLHVESQGSTSAGIDPRGVCRPPHEPAGRAGTRGKSAAGATPEAPVRRGGAAALTHRSRGRPSPRRLAPTLRDEVSRLMTTMYAGFNDQHLT